MTVLTQIGDDVATIVAQVAAISARVKELTEEAEALKAELRDRLTAPGDYTNAAGVPLVRIQPTRRFDTEAGVALLAGDERAACLAVRYDDVEVKKRLTELQIEQCMVVSGKAKVQVL